MSRSDEERVKDIIEISEILKILIYKGENYFLEEITHQWAVERALQNIGEACTKLSANFKELNPEIDWKSILGMRTYLAHAYHRIDADIVWSAANVSVPELVKCLHKKS